MRRGRESEERIERERERERERATIWHSPHLSLRSLPLSTPGRFGTLPAAGSYYGSQIGSGDWQRPAPTLPMILLLSVLLSSWWHFRSERWRERESVCVYVCDGSSPVCSPPVLPL